MKSNLIITALLFIVVVTAHGQDVNKCKPIAERILTAAQNHTSDGIDELLASDFHYNKIKQPTAAKVLKQIIAQMPAMTTGQHGADAALHHNEARQHHLGGNNPFHGRQLGARGQFAVE